MRRSDQIRSHNFKQDNYYSWDDWEAAAADQKRRRRSGRSARWGRENELEHTTCQPRCGLYSIWQRRFALAPIATAVSIAAMSKSFMRSLSELELSARVDILPLLFAIEEMAAISEKDTLFIILAKSLFSMQSYGYSTEVNEFVYD